MKRRFRTHGIAQICLACFFLLCVILPLARMLVRITPAGIKEVTSSVQFRPAVVSSVTTAFTASVISVAVALAAAWCLERTAIRGKALFAVLFTLPMLIPSISHAFGLVALFGSNGLLTNLLHLKSNIYGFWGVVTGSVMYSFPMAFLMISGMLQYEDGMPYKAASTLGIPRCRRFLDLTLPYLRKTLISAFFAVFTMVVTDYGVPLMVGGKMVTLSVLMYNKAASMMDYSAGSVIGAVLLIPAAAAFIIDFISRDSAQSGFVAEPVEPNRSRAAAVRSYIYCAAVSLFVILPIVAFVLMVFETKYPVNPTFTMSHIQKTFRSGAGEYLGNSLVYAVLSAALGTTAAFVCAYLTARVRGAVGKGLHLAAVTTMAIPGLVLGLSYVICFHGTPIYGTVFILVLANAVHFFASPYLMIYNTLAKLNPNLEDVGQSLGVGRLRIIRDVIIPKVRLTLVEMFVYFFVNAMMTISAVSFLSPPSPKPVALMINQFEAQRLMENAAFVSLLILGVNLLIKLFAVLCRRISFAGRSKKVGCTE